MWSLLLWVAVQAGFVDLTHCRVHAQFYVMGDEPMAVKRDDRCTDIRSELRDNALFLHTTHIWVAVVLPPTRGWEELTYEWGKPTAKINADWWQAVTWGRVGRG